MGQQASEEETETRIVQQMETAAVAAKGVEKKLKRHLRKADKNVSISEVLGDLGIDYKESGTVVESFKVIGVAPAVANAIQSGAKPQSSNRVHQLVVQRSERATERRRSPRV